MSQDQAKISKERVTHPGNQPDVYVRCPYFPEHELRRSRLPYHLPKCQNHPNAPKLVICPYNFTHRVRPEDRKEHLLNCEDKVTTRLVDKDPPSFKSTESQLNDRKTPLYRTAQIIDQHSAPISAYAELNLDSEEEW